MSGLMYDIDEKIAQVAGNLAELRSLLAAYKAGKLIAYDGRTEEQRKAHREAAKITPLMKGGERVTPEDLLCNQARELHYNAEELHSYLTELSNPD